MATSEWKTGEAYAKRGCPDRMNAAEVKAAQSNPEQFWSGVDNITESLVKTRDEGITTKSQPTKSWW